MKLNPHALGSTIAIMGVIIIVITSLILGPRSTQNILVWNHLALPIGIVFWYAIGQFFARIYNWFGK